MKNYNNCLFFSKYRDLLVTISSCVIILLGVVFLYISFFVKFDFVSSYSGFVLKEDDYYVVLYISDNELSSIKKDVLVVDNVICNYDIYKISDEYVISDYGPVRMVYLKFNLDDSDKIINNVLKLNFINRTTIFNYVKEKLLWKN